MNILDKALLSSEPRRMSMLDKALLSKKAEDLSDAVRILNYNGIPARFISAKTRASVNGYNEHSLPKEHINALQLVLPADGPYKIIHTITMPYEHKPFIIKDGTKEIEWDCHKIIIKGWEA